MEVRRHMMGLLGVAFLVVGVSLLIAKGTDDSKWSMFASICIRVGSTLAAIWLAFPQIASIAKRFSPWLLGAVFVVALICAARPRLILYLGPVVAAIALLQFIGWLFKPLPETKKKRRPNSSSDKQ